MMKWIIGILLVILTAVGTALGVIAFYETKKTPDENYAQSNNPLSSTSISFWNEDEDIEIIELDDFLIAVNDDNGRKQSLLLLDLVLYVDKKNHADINRDIPLIKNQVAKFISIKSEKYFYEKKAFGNIEEELTRLLIVDNKFRINKLLITKFVYQ